MNPTDKGRRSDSLYFGEISRRELCNMVSNLEGDLEAEHAMTYLADVRIGDLEAENEKLIVKLNAEHIVRQNVEIENAKLREAFNATLIRLSAANDAAGGGFMDSRYCELLRELGIEVNG